MITYFFSLYLLFLAFGLYSSELPFDFTGATPSYIVTPVGLRRPSPVVADNKIKRRKLNRPEVETSARSNLPELSVAEPQTQMTYTGLPGELQEHILSLLPRESLASVSAVSRRQRDIIARFRTSFSIPLSDITLERLRGPYKHVTHLTIWRHAVSLKRLGMRQMMLIAGNFPNLTHLRLPSLAITPDAFRLLVIDPAFARLKLLDISGNNLSDAPNFPVFSLLKKTVFNSSLEVLNISQTGITAEHTAFFAEPDLFVNLREIDVSDNLLENSGFTNLVNASFSRKLEKLVARKIGIQNNNQAQNACIMEACATLASLFPQLRIVDLSCNVLRDGPVSCLAQSVFAPQLEELYLSKTAISALPFTTIMNAKAFPKLRVLHVGFNNLADGGLAHLVNCAFVDSLEDLVLSYNGLCAANIQVFADREFPSLRRLSIDFNVLEDLGLKTLMRCPFSNRLVQLNIAKTGITQESALTIRTSNAFANLQELSIGHNNIGDTGLIDVAASAFAPNLEKLFIHSTNISYVSMQTIANFRAFPQLTLLNLSYNTGSVLTLFWLSRAAFAQQLTHLTMSGRALLGEAVHILSAPDAFNNLQELILQDNTLNDSLRLLAGSSFAPKLRILDLTRTGTASSFPLVERNAILSISFPNLRLYGSRHF